jgi:chromosome segregation ATPase
VTQAVKRTPADVLRQARRRDSDRKRDQVFRTVDAMKRDGIPITFAAVARTAKVSQWLVYADGVREYISTAHDAQTAEPSRNKRIGRSASEASLRTDLELAKQDNRRLRNEINHLKKAMRERLGTQLEVVSTATLRQRIDELTEANNHYRSENVSLATERDEARARLRIVEDDLAAARASIRRMIREHSQAPARQPQMTDTQAIPTTAQPKMAERS